MRIPLLFKIQGSIKTGSPADLKLQITICVLVCQFERSSIYDKNLKIIWNTFELEHPQKAVTLR
jgi:hypothetical protein